jgi:DOPA 4,5-dioxygenase
MGRKDVLVEPGQVYWCKSEPTRRWTITSISDFKAMGYLNQNSDKIQTVFIVDLNNKSSLLDEWAWETPKFTHVAYIYQKELHATANLYELITAQKFAGGVNIWDSRWAAEPPHPGIDTIRILFTEKAYYPFVSWLMLNRNEHSVLIHPLTGDWLKDRMSHSLWMGKKLLLDQDALDNEEVFTGANI